MKTHINMFSTPKYVTYLLFHIHRKKKVFNSFRVETGQNKSLLALLHVVLLQQKTFWSQKKKENCPSHSTRSSEPNLIAIFIWNLLLQVQLQRLHAQKKFKFYEMQITPHPKNIATTSSTGEYHEACYKYQNPRNKSIVAVTHYGQQH